MQPHNHTRNHAIKQTHQYERALATYYDKADPTYLGLVKSVREILQAEKNLQEIVQLVGKGEQKWERVESVARACLAGSCTLASVCSVRALPKAFVQTVNTLPRPH